jgi:glycosyltransferase involved in cell wall biosynthesis
MPDFLDNSGPGPGDDLVSLRQQLDEAQREVARLKPLESKVARLMRTLAQSEVERQTLIISERQAREARDLVAESTFWRATGPLRLGIALLRAPRRGGWREVPRVLAGWMAESRAEQWQLAAARIVRLADHSRAELPDRALDDEHYKRWVLECDTRSPADRAAISKRIALLRRRPRISIVLPVHNTPEDCLRAAIASVTNQLYGDWELCIADDASTGAHVRTILEEACRDDRVRCTYRAANGGISAATNSALQLANGEFVTFLDHDDLLAETALYEVVEALNQHPDAEVLYSDEDRLLEQGEARRSPYFKPDWDPDLLLGQNFVCHLAVYRLELVRRLGGLRLGFEGSQDHDLILRAAAVLDARHIQHIPAVLYHWRLGRAESFSSTHLDQCVTASRRAVEDHLAARPDGQGAVVIPHPRGLPYHRVVWPLPASPPLVSVIIPTRDQAPLLRRCVNGLLHRTDYEPIEVLLVDNGSRDADALALLEELSRDPRVRVLRDEGPFNYSRLNNRAAAEARGDVLLLLNNDIDVLQSDWLREMVSHALRPDVGTVGARLLFEDRTLQHGGVVLGVGDFFGGPGIAGHAGLHTPAEKDGYFCQLRLTRSVAANTAACLAVRRELYLRVDGLDEVNLPVSFNDIDFCLRIRELGLRNVWTPFAELLHLESASRGKDIAAAKAARAHQEMKYMRFNWAPVLDHDPYYNANFRRIDPHHRLPIPGRRVPPWRDPGEDL